MWHSWWRHPVPSAGVELSHKVRENPLIFLAGYQGLTAAANDPAYSHALAVLQSGYQTLVAVATAIETGTLRHSLLENVPANRDLLALCQQYFAQGVPDAPVDLAALNARCLAGWLLAGAGLNRPQTSERQENAAVRE